MSKRISPGWRLSARGLPPLTVLDLDGAKRDLAWLNAHFGVELDIRRAEPGSANHVMRLVQLRLHEGPCVQMVEVRGVEGEPFKCAIGRWWADAPGLNPYPADCLATRWRNKAKVGWTDEATGVVGFGMGKGDMPGSSGVWPIHCDAPADYVGNLGWMPGTNHRAIVATFQLFAVGDNGNGGGGEGPEMERIATAVETIAAFFSR